MGLQTEGDPDLLYAQWEGLVRQYAFNGSINKSDGDDPHGADSTDLMQYIGRPQITEAWSEELSQSKPPIFEWLS